MRRAIDAVADKYAERGHDVVVLSGNYIRVTDKDAGNHYLVSRTGRVLTNKEALPVLLALVAEEPAEKFTI